MADRMASSDMRFPGEPYCKDCPDHEACNQGAPCDLVREASEMEWTDVE